MKAIKYLLFLFCFLTMEISYASCPQKYCVIIIDAGSTGSRAHAYAYDLKFGSPFNIHELWVKKVKPGIAALGSDSEAISKYLSSLLADAPGHYPAYFYATGGMRLLSAVSQLQIYTEIKAWFIKENWSLKDIKTITGSEEGVFAWLAVNYSLGNLKANSRQVAVLDMGGASVQIVIPVKHIPAFISKDFVEFSLYGKNYILFSRSFLGLGETEVVHQFLDSPACFSNNYELPTGQVALGSAYNCELEVATLLNTVHKVNLVIPEIISANPQAGWYVIGGIVNLATSELINLKESFTAQELLDKAQVEICQQSWPILTASYPKDSYLYSLCLVSAYYVALITEGYGLNSQTKLSYLANQTQDWTLGAVLRLPL